MASACREDTGPEMSKKLLPFKWEHQVPSTNLISSSTILSLLRQCKNNKPMVAMLMLHDIIIHLVRGVDSIIKTLTTKQILSLKQRGQLFNCSCRAEKVDNLLSLIYVADEEKHIKDLVIEMQYEKNDKVVQMYHSMLQQIEDAVDFDESDLPDLESNSHHTTIMFQCNTTTVTTNLKQLLEENQEIVEEQVFQRNVKVTNIGKAIDRTLFVNIEIQDQWQAFKFMKSVDTKILENRIQTWYDVHQRSVSEDIKGQILFGIYTKDILNMTSYFNDGIKLSFIKNVETKNMHVLLVGQTGSGKSSLGNFILSASSDHVPGKLPFPTDHGTASVTVNNTKRTGVVSGIDITIVDTPGVFNIHTKDEHKLIKQEIVSAVKNSKRDYDAIIYVTRVFKRGLQMNDEEVTSLELVKEALGSEFWNHTVMTFTYGKDFERQMQDERRKSGEYNSFEQHLKRHEVSGNKYLIGPSAKQAQGAVLIDNTETNMYKKEHMVRSLLLKIDEVVKRNKNKGYGVTNLPNDLEYVDNDQDNNRDTKLWELFILLAVVVIGVAVFSVYR